MDTNNIFIKLEKYCSGQSENYLTEAFVFMLNSLLEKERTICLEILRSLCFEDDERSFFPNENISISTQVTTDHGRPDIKISSPSKLIFIEVKQDSRVNNDQIERYKAALKSSDATLKRVVLLSKHAVEFNERQSKPDKHVRWFEIYNWIMKAKAENSVSRYLVKSFISFLEAKKMSIQRISWEYINGVTALLNLLNMVEAAIQSISPNNYKKTVANAWNGFYFQDGKYFYGIYLEKPLFLVFETYRENQEKIVFELSLESEHFFSLNKDEQLEKITAFLRESYETVMKDN
jgi:hypothetical protein